MASIYRTVAEIDFHQPVCIQQRLSSGQFSDTLPSATDNLVFENGIWKYGAVASGGAVDITSACRLRAIIADLGASANWTGYIKGNPNNTTSTPYPSADAAKFAEGTVVFGSGTSVQQVCQLYAPNSGPIFHKGQRCYFVTTSASTPVLRVYFEPFYT